MIARAVQLLQGDLIALACADSRAPFTHDAHTRASEPHGAHRDRIELGLRSRGSILSTGEAAITKDLEGPADCAIRPCGP